jgi:hypothetical protein
LALDAIVLKGAGVFGEIFLGSELRGIDEDRYHHAGVFLPGLLDEGEVTGVETAHGRHETNGLPSLPRLLEGLAEGGYGFNHLHFLNVNGGCSVCKAHLTKKHPLS